MWTKKSRQRGRQETSRWPSPWQRPGPWLITKLWLKRERYLPMIWLIQHNCAGSYKWTIEALETGVKCRADVECLQEPPRDRGGIGISHSAYEIRTRKRVWIVIWKGSGLVVDERTDLSRGANEDVIATDVRRRGEKITRIVNVYDQNDAQSGEIERPARKLNWQSHSVGRHCSRRTLQRPQQTMGPMMPSAAECCVLGRCDWRESTGDWKWRQAPPLLDKREPGRRVGHRPDAGKLTNCKVDHTGR